MKKTLIGLAVVGLIAWLFVPVSPPAIPPPAGATPFLWDQDELWSTLESEFRSTRSAGCAGVSERIDGELGDLSNAVGWLETGGHSPSDDRFDAMEQNLFAVAPLVAACSERVSTMLDVVTRLRSALKR